MSFAGFFRSLKSPELRLAWAVAVAADALQIVAFPLFAEGGLSPADAVLDIVVAATLVRLLGWHWAFLPSLLGELVPGFDLFPNWTAAVWYVTRESEGFLEPLTKGPDARGRQPDPKPDPEPEFLPPGPAPARRS
ncbi:MAG TPA: hypothetical protein VMH85_15650 [Terriglobales bacterium]|nr:hypothetical protein [Terriglobales bacterium]